MLPGMMFDKTLYGDVISAELNSEAESEHQEEATEVEAKKVARPQGR
jgi:hypothetical protein